MQSLVRPSFRSTIWVPRRLLSAPASAPQKIATPESTPTINSDQTPPMSWTEYFQHRRRRIIRNQLLSYPTGVLSFATAMGYFLEMEIDPTATVYGIDPFIVGIAGTLGVGVLGGLVAPLVGNFVWNVTHRDLAKALEKRDKDFHHRIVRHRVDPGLSSYRNPVPDYYGEKIKSLEDYRKWLRKQRDHARKSEFHLGQEE